MTFQHPSLVAEDEDTVTLKCTIVREELIDVGQIGNRGVKQSHQIVRLRLYPQHPLDLMLLHQGAIRLGVEVQSLATEIDTNYF